MKLNKVAFSVVAGFFVIGSSSLGSIAFAAQSYCGPYINTNPRTICCYGNMEYSAGATIQNGKLVCKAGTPEPVGYASGNAHWQSNK